MSTARVIELRYVGLAVADVEAERAFFGETFGLTEVADQGGMVYFAAEGSSEPYVIRLRQDPEQKTDIIGFSARDRADVDALHEHVTAMGVSLISAPGPLNGPAGGYGFRFFDPDGRALEVSAEMTPRRARELARGEAIPVRLSHIVIHSGDVRKLADFYQDALGFKLSDWIGEFMVFLRCNAAHHRLAILPGPPSLNHVAFDVLSIDELMRGLARLRRDGVPLQWGPGRHTAGNNTFSYYTTPNGNAVEYTSDLEDVDDATWRPQVYPFSPDVTDQWGTGRLIVDAPHPQGRPDAGLWKAPV